VQHPQHLEAKVRQHDWLGGYPVVISQVIRRDSDARLAPLLPATSASPDRR
jgi:hypothetical protein